MTTRTPLAPLQVRSKDLFPAYELTTDNLHEVAAAITAAGFTEATVETDPLRLWCTNRGRTWGRAAHPGDVVVDQGLAGVIVFGSVQHLTTEFDVTESD